MKKQNIWFVIVTYKPDKEVLGRLKTVLEGQSTIIVDNTNNNIGYGAAANQGMRQAFSAGARWVVVCNQDITLTKYGIAHFFKELEKCPPGIVGPEAGVLDPKRWTTVLASRPGLVPDDRLLYISGSMIAIHKDVWQATGGFYEPYFMYYEDVDLSVRARYAGFPLKQISIEGFRHGSSGKNYNSLDPRLRGDDKQAKEYYLARNHLLFVRRLAPVSVKLHELVRLLKTIIEHSQIGNIDAMRGISDFSVGRLGRRLPKATPCPSKLRVNSQGSGLEYRL